MNWTAREVNILKTMYNNHFASDIAKVLNRPLSQIYNQAFRCGFKKPEEFYKSKEFKELGIKTRFRKGHKGFRNSKVELNRK
jgi:hypothetical protein